MPLPMDSCQSTLPKGKVGTQIWDVSEAGCKAEGWVASPRRIYLGDP